MAGWGLAKDEFLDTDHWPHQLYVREARRMLGAYVMTQADIMENRTKADSVGLGSYNTDSHHVQRVVQPDGSALNEGDFQVGVTPLRDPLPEPDPRAVGVHRNLLVPVCMSASHVAYGTVRMEPVYMILGHASGVAASLAYRGQGARPGRPGRAAACRSLPTKASILRPDQVPGPPKVLGNGLDPAKLAGVVVDDPAGVEGGRLAAPRRALGPFVGDGYLHDGGKADGMARIRFTPRLPKAGRYEVRLYSSPNPNRATNALVAIHSLDGDRTIRVDQRRADQGRRRRSSWVSIPSPRGTEAGSRSATTAPTAT